jgi:hypothetical protein
MLNSILSILCLLFSEAYAEPISSKAQQNKQIIEDMDVDHKWLPRYQVNWDNGLRLPGQDSKKPRRKLTHCSFFVAAVATKLLQAEAVPPRPGSIANYHLLANKQFDWYKSEGANQGWKQIKEANIDKRNINAQNLANQGYLVVAIFANPDKNKHGHTSIVIPSDKSVEQIKAEGPDTAQAGMINSSCISLAKGYAHHKINGTPIFERGYIQFFYHQVNPAS